MRDNLAYQEDIREELINGKVVAMSPRPAVNHNYISYRLISIFMWHLKGRKCVPFGDGTDLYLDEDNRFIPDGMVVCDREKIRRNGVYGAPDLVWEILSPSTSKNDKWTKKNVYESAGVPEYWIVDPAGHTVEIYLLQDGQYVLDNLCTWFPPEELTEMTEEEKADLVTEFKCHLYDDLIIRMDDIFCDLF